MSSVLSFLLQICPVRFLKSSPDPQGVARFLADGTEVSAHLGSLDLACSGLGQRHQELWDLWFKGVGFRVEVNCPPCVRGYRLKGLLLLVPRL